MFLFRVFSSACAIALVGSVTHADAETFAPRKVSLGESPRSEDADRNLEKLLDRTEYVKPLVSSAPTNLQAPNQKFELRFKEFKGDMGDFQRYTLYLFDAETKKETLLDKTVAWAAISPDSKYVVYEPMMLIDVATGKQFDLSKELGIPNYITLHFWSKDGRSFAISQTDCGMDCPKTERYGYWKILLK